LFQVKRVYEKPDESDGLRILVDRLWPRGLTKEEAKIDKWLKDIAPSNDLRKWFAHRGERWQEFKRRYLEEVKDTKELLIQLKELENNKKITLLYAAKDKERNNAQALLEFINKI
jgi:uncharacterized protein YeaO (DUF488 family)